MHRSLQAGVPWVAVNVLQQDGTHLAAPFFLKQVGDVRVLITGVATPATPRMSFPEHVADSPSPIPLLPSGSSWKSRPVPLISAWCLSHLGYGGDLLLAQQVPGIKVIIGGHTHTVLSRPVRIGTP